MASEKLYYSMGEVSEMLDVNPSLVRFWEQKFDVIKPRKNKKGNRMFTSEDVQNLKTIYHLVKERGMTLSGAQKYMKASRKDIERDMEIAERLQSIKALLLEVRQSLGGTGVVVEEDFEEQKPAHAHVPDRQEIEEIVEQAHEEEVIDSMMDDVIEELINEPEEMLDFDPEAGLEMPEEEPERKPEEPQKPIYIEQTLF